MIPTVDPSILTNVPGVQILGVAALIYLLLTTVCVAVPKIGKNPMYKRLLSLCIPEFLGVGAFLLLPSLSEKTTVLGLKIIYGIAAGMLSTKTHKIIAQTILGRDKDIRTANAKASTPPEPPVAP